MIHFAPVFSKIVDSSLWSEPDHVCKVFVTLLALKDSDHIARVTAYGLGRKCWPTDLEHGERRALEAIAVLSSPDTRRIEPQPFEGRRIERVTDGWLILNGQYYEDLMREVSRKAYKARKEREYRARNAELKAAGLDRNGNPLPKQPKRGKPLKGESLGAKCDNNGNPEGAAEVAAQLDAELASRRAAVGVAVPPRPCPVPGAGLPPLDGPDL